MYFQINNISLRMISNLMRMLYMMYMQYYNLNKLIRLNIYPLHTISIMRSLILSKLSNYYYIHYMIHQIKNPLDCMKNSRCYFYLCMLDKNYHINCNLLNVVLLVLYNNLDYTPHNYFQNIQINNLSKLLKLK